MTRTSFFIRSVRVLGALLFLIALVTRSLSVQAMTYTVTGTTSQTESQITGVPPDPSGAGFQPSPSGSLYPPELTPYVDPFSLRQFGAFSILGSNNLIAVLSQLINTFLGFLGIIFVLLVLLSGFRYLVSQGDEEKTAEAKKTIANAIIGIIIILSAFGITNYVFNALSQATDTGSSATLL